MAEISHPWDGAFRSFLAIVGLAMFVLPWSILIGGTVLRWVSGERAESISSDVDSPNGVSGFASE